MAKRKTTTWPPDFGAVAELKPNRHRVYESVPTGGQFELPMPPGSAVTVYVPIAYDAYDGLYHYGLTLRQPMEKGGVSSFAPASVGKAFETAREAMKAAIEQAIGDLIQEGNPPGEDFRPAAVSHLRMLMNQLEEPASGGATNQPVNQEQRNPAMCARKRFTPLSERVVGDPAACEMVKDFRLAMILRGLDVVRKRARLTVELLEKDLDIVKPVSRSLYDAMIEGGFVRAVDGVDIAQQAEVVKEPIIETPRPDREVRAQEVREWAGKNSALIERAKKAMSEALAESEGDGHQHPPDFTVGWINEHLSISYDLACKVADHLVDVGFLRTGCGAVSGSFICQNPRCKKVCSASEPRFEGMLGPICGQCAAEAGMVGPQGTTPPAALAVKSAVPAPLTAVPTIEHLPPAKHTSLRPSEVRVVAGQNYRQTFDEGKLNLLGESMKNLDQLQEIVLNQHTEDGKTVIDLVAGERRLRAAIKSGMELIDCKLYKNLTPLQIDQVMDLENAQHEKLNPMEEGFRYARKLRLGYSIAQLKEVKGDSDDTIRRYVALTRLAPPIHELVASGRLHVHQAQLIARVGDVAKQIELVESATRMVWDNKAMKWGGRGDYHYRGNKPGYDILDEESPADRDYVKSMDGLREDVAHAMQGLAACGWLKVERENGEFANGFHPAEGRGRCEGCPDNTATYADQPALFAGVSPRGSDKKGFCTNKACYDGKSAAWEKVRSARIKEELKEQQKRMDKARKAGLAVCECGHVEDVGEVFKNGQCPKCQEKAKKAKASGRGEDQYDRQRREAKEKAARFPSNAKERFAVALWKHLVACYAAVGKHIAGLAPAKCDLTVVGTVLRAATITGVQIDDENGKLIPKVKDLANDDRVWTGEALAKVWANATETNKWQSPHVEEHNGAVENVPLGKGWIAEIEEQEYIAKVWEITIPDRPQEKDFSQTADAISADDEKTDERKKLEEKAKAPKKAKRGNA